MLKSKICRLQVNVDPGLFKLFKIHCIDVGKPMGAVLSEILVDFLDAKSGDQEQRAA